MMEHRDELTLQESFAWARSAQFADYNTILAHYQAKVCLEHARGTSLLDIPCGDATLTAMLVPHFQRVVGVDASATHLSAAKQRLPQVEFQHALMEDVEFNEKFDTVTMLNILEHVSDPGTALRKATSFLSADGVLIVHVPNSQAVNRKLAVLMGTLISCEELSPFDINVAGHRRSYELSSLCSDIERSGLRLIATGGIFYKSLSTPQMDWLLKNGLWAEGGFGWGRVGAEKRDWKAEFCRASYELGKERPEDCNIIYACATLR